MIAFECVFGVAGSGVQRVPSLPFLVPTGNGESVTLEEIYSTNSNQDIALTLNGSALTNPLHTESSSVDEGILRDALGQLAPGAASSPPTQIGVIFSNFYTPLSTIFGIMFDTGVDGGRPPRDGCAVFLGSIAQARINNGNLDDYFTQVAFTTVHELGHVFNLIHVDPSLHRCFLNTSSEDSVLPPSAFSFVEDQQQLLATCSTNASVTPGMSAFRGTDTASQQDSGGAIGSEPPAEAWTLNIQMSETVFWTFTPVELKVSLVLDGKAAQAAEIPDEFDPGYSRFKLWIEYPNGERRRYRPTMHYCDSRQKRLIAPGESYERDISIFGQAGGYVFQEPGTYRIWATFDISGKKKLKSKKISATVLPLKARGKAARSELETMRSLVYRGRRTLFYKSAKLWPLEIAALDELIRRHEDSSAAGAAYYALGKALLAHSKGSASAVRENWVRRAERYLSCAEQHSKLDDHRRVKAGRLKSSIRG